MDFADFYELASYGNENWKGNFTPKEVALNAYDYLVEFELSCKQHKATHVISNLLTLLDEDNTEESREWATNIRCGIRRICR